MGQMSVAIILSHTTNCVLCFTQMNCLFTVSSTDHNLNERWVNLMQYRCPYMYILGILYENYHGRPDDFLVPTVEVTLLLELSYRVFKSSICFDNHWF